MRPFPLVMLSLVAGVSWGITPTPGQPLAEQRGDERPGKPGLVLPSEAFVRLTTGLDSSGNATHIHPVRFSPDGSRLAWGDRKDHTIRIWNVKTHKQEWKLHGHESYVLCTAYSPDGTSLASGSYDGSIRIWDLLTGRTLRVLRPEGAQPMVYDVAFSPDGKALASGDWNGNIRLWDVAKGKLLFTARGGLPEAGNRRGTYVQAVTFTPDGKTLVSGSGRAAVQFWDVATGEEREKLRKFVLAGTKEEQAECPVTSLDFSPDGKILAAAFLGGDLSIRLWDMETGEEAPRLDGTGSAYTVDFSSDGKYLLSSARNLRIWELASRKTVLRIDEPRELLYGMYSGSFSPDGRLLCSGGQDNAVILWDAYGLGRDWTPPVASRDNLDRLWEQLGEPDPAVAYRAIGVLSKLGDPAVTLLGERIRAVEEADPRRIEQWVRELDDDSFDTREKAERELRKVGELAEQAVRKAFRDSVSAEVRMRARRLLSKVVLTTVTRTRALVVLENVGSREAWGVLETLAKGDARAPLTREAGAALARLARRPAAER